MWTWVAIDADTKLIPTGFIGGRDAGAAYHFMHDLADRLANRVQLAQCMGARKATQSGKPEWNHISTSYVERQNLTMRMSMKRFARLSNGFSKKVENHEHMVALHYLYYNFGRIHQTLRVTPAMEAGVADHVWSIDEIISLLDAR